MRDSEAFNPFIDKKSRAHYHPDFEGKPFTLKVKKQAYLRENGKCEECGVAVNFPGEDNRTFYQKLHNLKNPTAEFDHEISKNHGGENKLWNCSVKCPKCNRSKSDKLDIKGYEFLVKMKRYICGAVPTARLVDYLNKHGLKLP